MEYGNAHVNKALECDNHFVLVQFISTNTVFWRKTQKQSKRGI